MSAIVIPGRSRLDDIEVGVATYSDRTIRVRQHLDTILVPMRDAAMVIAALEEILKLGGRRP